MKKDSDVWSWLVVCVTLTLFLTALFLKGFTHDLLLEAGIFMVSVKLIMLAHQNQKETSRLQDRLDDVRETLRRIEAGRTKE